jgi:hypothetical protein
MLEATRSAYRILEGNISESTYLESRERFAGIILRGTDYKNWKCMELAQYRVRNWLRY